MSNSVHVSVFINNFEKIMKLEETGSVALYSGQSNVFFDEKPIEINLGNFKTKVTTFQFLQAFKDMLETGVFELDQIDSVVWDIEIKLETLGNQNEYLIETLREIRGGL